MAWIESHQGLARHIKTKRLARKLGINVPAVIGHLHLLWWWSMDNTPDGNLSELEPEDIADEMMWEEDPNDLIHALIESGFLDNINGELYIHDFYDYVGKLVEKRKADAERKRTKRGQSKDSPEDVQRTSEGIPEDGAGNSTVPNSTVHNKDIKHIVDFKDCDISFNEWWDLYPTSGSVKKTALDKWKKLWKDKSFTVDEMMDGTKRYINHQKHYKFNICAATVFLNQERWKGEWQTDKKIEIYEEELNSIFPEFKELEM